MNGATKAIAAIAQSSALVQVLIHVIWRTTGEAIPQEVSLNCVIGFAPIIYGIMTWFENRTGIDIVANGNGAAVGGPLGQSQSKEHP